MFNYLSFPSQNGTKLSLLLIIASILILSHQSSYYPLRSTYWGSYQYKVAYSNGANITGTTPVLYFTVPFLSAATNILDMSAVLSSYQLAVYPNMLFRVTKPTYSTALQSASFGVQVVSPSSFVYFRFFIVYNTQTALNFFEINWLNATCMVANGTMGTYKTEVLTSTTRLAVVGNDTYNVQPVLSSIMLYNGNQTMFFVLNTSATPVVNTTVSINLVTHCVITELIVTVFILKTSIVPFEYVFYTDKTILVTKSNTSLSTLCTNNFNIPPKNGPLIFNQNCSIAVNSLVDDNVGVLRNINFDATVAGSPAFTSCVNSAQTAASGTMNIGFSVFCSYTVICTNTSEYYSPLLAPTNSCNPCSSLTALCKTCNLTHCYTCLTGHYPLYTSGTNTCPTCTQTNCTLCLSVNTCGACLNSSYLLNQTCQSCTNLTNCLYCSSSTFCLSCVNGYGPDPTGTCYVCNAMIPQCTICQNYYTCTQCSSNYYVSPGGSSCTSCAFNITNCISCINSYNCTGCSTGYYLQGISTCIPCTQAVPYCSGCTGNGTCNSCYLGYFLANSSSCQACSIPGCTNCTALFTCVSCSSGYFLDGGNQCTKCTDPNCYNCTSATFCAQCFSDYNLNADNITCSCKIGWPITNVCINVTACVTAAKISNVSTCVFCNSMHNFIISGTTCVCKTGYKQSGDQCYTICGDGLTISPEVCDDGNNNDGDGCSSTCTLESNYNCTYDGSIYKCRYTSNFTINLEYILKSQSQNSGTFFFSISPTTPNLQLINHTKLSTMTIISSTSYAVRSIGYSSGMISVITDFTKDIQGLNAVFSLNFDTSYFNSNNITYSLVAVGTNQPLIVNAYVTHLQYLKICAYALLGLAGIIFLLSSAYEKMIGIETINVIQIIVFSKLLYVQNDILISGGISSLKYIEGYNDLGKNMAHTNQVPLTYRRLQFSSDYILNFQTGLIMIGVSLIIFLIFSYYKLKTLNFLQKTKKGSIDEFKLAQQRLQEKKRFIYERIFLVVACVNLFDCMAAIRLQSRSLEGQSHYTYFFFNLIAMIFTIIYIFSIMTYEILNVGKQHTWIAYFCSYSDYYVGYYLCYILVVTPFLVGAQGFSGMTAIFIVVGFVIIHSAITIFWRPYKQVFHNIALIFNNCVLLFVLAISAVMLMMNVPDSLQLIWAYTVMGLIFLMEIFAFVRLYMASQKAPKENQRMNRGIEGEDELKKGMEMMEKQYLNPNKKLRNPISRAQMEEDDLIKLRNRLKKQFKAKNNEQMQQI